MYVRVDKVDNVYKAHICIATYAYIIRLCSYNNVGCVRQLNLCTRVRYVTLYVCMFENSRVV